MDKLQVAKAVKAKRNSLNLSQSDLAYKSGVSFSVIGKIEKGENVKDINLTKVLLTLGMKETLNIIRDEETVTGYKSLSVEDLKSVMSCCKEIFRESSDANEKSEFANYRNLAEAELKLKIRDIFRGA